MKHWKRSWTLLCMLLSLTLPAAWAQVATTAVQDTVYRADGTPAAGSVVISWNAFTTALGNSVPAGTISVTIGAGGGLAVNLAPNADATPMGSYYTAIYHLNDGSTNREYWVVPALPSGSAPVKLGSIRNTVLPLSLAMQTVSKSYVDTAIAGALLGVPQPDDASAFVQKSGDTMTGPLVLSGDPVSEEQAATKNYVDTSVARLPLFGPSGTMHSAGVVPDPGPVAGNTRYLREDGTFAVPAAGGGGSPTGTAGGDLSGSYPNPTVTSVHATAGTLDSVTVGATTPAPGTFSTFRIANPGSGITTLAISDTWGPQFTTLDTLHPVQLVGASLYVGAPGPGNTDSGSGNVFASGAVTATNVNVTALTGTGNAFACLDATGKLYRSATPCS